MSGSGPFKLVSWKPGVEIVMERNENYWGPKPKAKRVIYKIIPEDSTREMLLTKRERSMSCGFRRPRIMRCSRSTKNLKVIGAPSIRTTYIDMNRNMPPFDNILVRKALCYSFPYEAVTQEYPLWKSRSDDQSCSQRSTQPHERIFSSTNTI